jgi:DNA-directed RNA polymerase I subunit RPA1
MEQYVKAVLKSKKKKHVRDDYKDDLVYQERRKVLNEFGKKAYARCSHCTAFGNTFRKEKAVKIIEYDLTPKQKLANQASNLRRTSPSFGKKHKSKAASDDEGLEASASGSSASEEEDDAMEVDESEEDEDEDEGIVNDGVARTASGQVKGVRGRNERVMAAAEVRDHLRRLFQLESEICSLLYGRHGAPSAGSTDPVPPPIADMFFMDVIPVTPTRFRPPARMGDDLFENAQNSLLNAVIQTCIRTREINQTLLDLDNQDKSEELMERLKSIDKNRTFELLLESLVKLQNDVNSFMDSTKNPTVMKQGKLPPQGVKQLLEKKEGLFRKHMMGKRVNYAARSVISPDINVETNEIGIPPVFAKKLTYPEPVTANNVAEMRQLVINGPKIHPGAAIVQNEDGSKVSLDRMTLEQRTALANQLLTPQNDSFVGSSSGPAPRNKKVYRHIRDGDIVILNRQPTLHKPSMMCHRVKVLKGEKTIRMHYANCNSYNADFDGDEMNIHFPRE